MHGSDEVRNSLGKAENSRPIITRIAKGITTHTRAHNTGAVVSQGGLSLGRCSACIIRPGAQMQAIINFGHCRKAHTQERRTGPSKNAPVPLMLGSHRSGADSARILSTQPCIHKASQRMHPGLRGGNKAVTDERRLFDIVLCSIDATFTLDLN